APPDRPRKPRPRRCAPMSTSDARNIYVHGDTEHPDERCRPCYAIHSAAAEGFSRGGASLTSPRLITWYVYSARVNEPSGRRTISSPERIENQAPCRRSVPAATGAAIQGNVIKFLSDTLMTS